MLQFFYQLQHSLPNSAELYFNGHSREAMWTVFGDMSKKHKQSGPCSP